jgi:hypothetical protein
MDKPTYTGTVTAILAVVFTSIVIVFYITWKLSRREIEKFAASLPGPPTVPLFGNAFDLAINPRGTVQRLKDNLLREINTGTSSEFFRMKYA